MGKSRAALCKSWVVRHLGRIPRVRLQKNSPKICQRLDGVGTLCYLLEYVGSETSRMFVSFPEGEEGCGVTAQAAQTLIAERCLEQRGVENLARPVLHDFLCRTQNFKEIPSQFLRKYLVNKEIRSACK